MLQIFANIAIFFRFCGKIAAIREIFSYLCNRKPIYYYLWTIIRRKNHFRWRRDAKDLLVPAPWGVFHYAKHVED